MTSSADTTGSERPDLDPWVLVNLIRFNRVVETDDGEAMAGADAYERYLSACRPVLSRFGAEVIWAGETRFAVAGLAGPTPAEAQPQWDRVVVTRYPTPAAYRAFIGDPEFRQALVLRDLAVAETEVLVCATDAAYAPNLAASSEPGG